MPRAIWKGNISFGLVNIPVQLFSAEKTAGQVRMHLLDKKSHSRIHNKRVNDKGQEVPWENIDHAYEFAKGKYVVVDQKMLEQAAVDNYETVEIIEFVPLTQILPIYYAKPYYLLPGESGIKGYVLLHDILQKTKQGAIAKVVIKTREHLAVIMPQQEFMALITLRYANELYDVNEILDKNPIASAKYKIHPREMQLASALVQNMSKQWHPDEFHDDSKEILQKLIKQSIKKGKTITNKAKRTSKAPAAAERAENVLDFMELLKKSVKHKAKHSTPQHKSGHKRRKG